MKKEEQYIISESQEVVEGESTDWVNKLLRAFPAFSHANYRLYFAGNFVSLVGTWLQNVAQGYLVYELTNSATWIGVIAALQTLPVLLFALFGGLIVDSFPKKRILYYTQSVQMVLAFILAALTLLHLVTPYHIALLSFFLGVSTALDMPARQTFVHKIVRKDALLSAISINAGLYNAARIIGPAAAGILIGIFGVGVAFLINGLSFVAVLIALRFINVHEKVEKSTMHPLRAIKEGLQYAFSHTIIRPLLILTTISSIIGWSYITIMPILAKDIFKQGASGLGYLQSAAGLGAVTSAILISIFSKKIPARIFIFGGSALFTTSMFVLSYVHSFVLGMAVLFCMACGLLAFFSMINTTLQHNSPPAARGRVISIYTLMFVGMNVFGSLEIGFVTQSFGVLNALRLNAILLACSTMLVYKYARSLRTI